MYNCWFDAYISLILTTIIKSIYTWIHEIYTYIHICVYLFRLYTRYRCILDVYFTSLSVCSWISTPRQLLTPYPRPQRQINNRNRCIFWVFGFMLFTHVYLKHLLCERIKGLQKSLKINESAFSDALLMSRGKSALCATTTTHTHTHTHTHTTCGCMSLSVCLSVCVCMRH
jgi:Ca2+/Na+ antiporter